MVKKIICIHTRTHTHQLFHVYVFMSAYGDSSGIITIPIIPMRKLRMREVEIWLMLLQREMVKSGTGIQSFQVCAVNYYTIPFL